MSADLETLRTVLTKAALSAETRRRLLWGLDQLPPLYRDLEKTCDVRYRDGIQTHVHGMLLTLSNTESGSPDAAKTMEKIVTVLQAMHQERGIPSLGLKHVPPPKGALPPPKRPRKRKASSH